MTVKTWSFGPVCYDVEGGIVAQGVASQLYLFISPLVCQALVLWVLSLMVWDLTQDLSNCDLTRDLTFKTLDLYLMACDSNLDLSTMTSIIDLT